MSICVIGDVHACSKTLKALLDKLPLDDEIAFVGDLIDRGPGAKEVLDIVKDNGFLCVKGNHEQMLLDCENSRQNTFDWLMSGGNATARSFGIDPDLFITIDDSYWNWIKNLPLYIHRSDLVNKDGCTLLITHTGQLRPWKKALESEDFLWNRQKPIRQDGVYNIFGHTPTRKPIIDTYYANIDGGCCYGVKSGYGKLYALRFPEMTVFEQENIDT